MGISYKLRLERREMFQQQRRQVSIFTKVQEILHVQRVNTILRVILDHLVRNEQRLVGVGCAKTIERETTR